MSGAGPAWEWTGTSLRRVVDFDSHPEAVEMIVRLSRLFEEHQHHADIGLSLGTLTLELTTHDAGEVVTATDHSMANLIDEVLDSDA